MEKNERKRRDKRKKMKEKEEEKEMNRRREQEEKRSFQSIPHEVISHFHHPIIHQTYHFGIDLLNIRTWVSDDS